MLFRTIFQISLFLLPLAACQHFDKAAHFAVGAGVSHAVTAHTKSPVAGCLAAIGVGLAKEAIDDQADPLDLIATGMGCSVTIALQ